MSSSLGSDRRKDGCGPGSRRLHSAPRPAWPPRGIDRHVPDGAAAQGLIGDDRVLAIQEQHPKLLGLGDRPCRCGNRRSAPARTTAPRAAEPWPGHPAARTRPPAAVADRPNGPRPRPAGCGVRMRRRRRSGPLNVASSAAGQGLDVDLGYSIEQQKLQHLVIWHRRMTALKKAGPQPFTMTPVMRPCGPVRSCHQPAARRGIGLQPVRHAEGPA